MVEYFFNDRVRSPVDGRRKGESRPPCSWAFFSGWAWVKQRKASVNSEVGFHPRLRADEGAGLGALMTTLCFICLATSLDL